MAEIMGLFGHAQFRLAALQRRSIRLDAVSSPAISRSSEVLPAPLGPVTASASPRRRQNPAPKILRGPLVHI